MINIAVLISYQATRIFQIFKSPIHLGILVDTHAVVPYIVSFIRDIIDKDMK